MLKHASLTRYGFNREETAITQSLLVRDVSTSVTHSSRREKRKCVCLLTIIPADWFEATSSFIKAADRARLIEGLSRAVRW
jgi:hypothetical protein